MRQPNRPGRAEYPTPTELQMMTGFDIHRDDLVAPPYVAPEALTARKVNPAGESPTVALFGNFGSNNSGNEGSLQAMVDFLRRERPEARLFCVCADPLVVRNSLGIPAIPIRRSGRQSGISHRAVGIPLKVLGKVRDLVRAFREIRRADVMIVPGTGILDDFGEPPQGMPLDIFIWCLAARMSGTKLAFASVGAGPIGHPLSRWLMVSAARLAHYRSYRDTLSKDFMGSAGLNVTNDAVYPDIAFKLATPAGSARIPSETRPLTVGVGVMKYNGWYGFADGGRAVFDTYLDRLARFTLYLLEGGHCIKLLTGETTDMEAVDALVARLQSIAPAQLLERVSAGRSSSLHGLMEEISETDIVVATRFHNIVCALKMEKPVISLGYSAKNDVLLAEMGLGEYCQHVETFDVDVLIAHFGRAVAASHEIKNAIRARNLAFRKLLDLQDGRLLSDILPRGR
jgi:polysaccharide pyruvyl transferase WcaK-like protein